ncbi:CCR4-NOT transcription complex subunit 3-like isoform X2 [Oscarella lobularis]|uniref:CCR4-NOT transcription complex subunit 3-like isoform X2 n=1 Tax=Oscarella lobularis TaxID=121494 RepID=UPI0033132F3D
MRTRFKDRPCWTLVSLRFRASKSRPGSGVEMADKRKLQGEIDRCLKKVSEGVETFEDIWQKVHSATNPNQKEKYESDLKKEIKKLQRLRDQIKTWLQSNDIKDKRQLQDNRKIIETQMERFKVVERETKTKAYSKEGLQGFATKVDPAQKEKEDIRGWLSESIESLNRQVEQFESEMETLHVGSKRKRGDKEKQERLDGLKMQVERHGYHVVKLETVMRMLDNDSISIDVVKNLQDGVIYYTESNQDPDFTEDEYLYDDLELDEQMMGQPILASPAHHNNVEEDWEAAIGKNSPVNSFPMSPPSAKSGFKNDDDKKKGSRSTDVTINDVHSAKKKTVSTSSQGSGGSTGKTNSKSSSHKASVIVAAAAKSITTNNGTSPAPVSRDSKTAGGGPAFGASYSAAAGGSQQQQQQQQQQAASAQQAPAAKQPPTQEREDEPREREHPSPSPRQSSPQRARASSREPSLPDALSSNDLLTTTLTTTTTASVTMTTASSVAAIVENSLEAVAVNSRLSPEAVSSGSVSSVSYGGGGGSGDGRLSQDSPVFTPVTSASVTPPPSSSLSVASHLANLNLSTAPQQQLQQQESPSPSSHRSLAMASDALLVRHVEGSGGAHVGVALAEMDGEVASQRENVNWQLDSLKSIAAQAVAQAGLDKESLRDARPLVDQVSHVSLALSAATTTVTTAATSLQEPVLMQPLDPVLGAAPLGRVRLTKERSSQLAMLDSASQHLPQAADSERVRPHLPHNPFPTQPHHHPHPPAHFDSFDFFQRLSPETLFFIFYYQEGTRAQYLAAKALKKQAWRFHTKYLMWFQRHEEPKAITDEYEQGTYIYFDYEKWQQRKKEGFTFEYRFLEDKDLP